MSLAFALRGDFPWRRVPLYLVAQFAGAILATLLIAVGFAYALRGRGGDVTARRAGSGALG